MSSNNSSSSEQLIRRTIVGHRRGVNNIGWYVDDSNKRRTDKRGGKRLSFETYTNTAYYEPEQACSGSWRVALTQSEWDRLEALFEREYLDSLSYTVLDLIQSLEQGCSLSLAIDESDIEDALDDVKTMNEISFN